MRIKYFLHSIIIEQKSINMDEPVTSFSIVSRYRMITVIYSSYCNACFCLRKSRKGVVHQKNAAKPNYNGNKASMAIVLRWRYRVGVR